ncbi:hypothetical protein HHI36_023032 [Cryptolaemus montrouzieri]|uniref:Uncharacterized protein n=4 Tax=Cryptolaemus montrouzieri TaxID=559131 RepID=A0ABD2PFR3_9CUCU
MTDDPRFAEPIPNVTVALGRDASLPCVVENLGTYKKMVRTYKPKTDRKISMKKALKMQYVKYCQKLYLYAKQPTNMASKLQPYNIASKRPENHLKLPDHYLQLKHPLHYKQNLLYHKHTGYHDLTDENTHNTQDLHFVDSEASQNNEVVDREQNKTPTLDADPVSVSDADDPLHVSSSKAILTPEVVRPYPKKAITDSVLKRKGREKGRSRIYTETPEKNRLESLRNEKNRKRELQKAKQHAKELKTAENLLGLTEPKKKKRVTSLPSEIDSDSSQDEVVMTSDSEDIEMPSESEEEVINEEPVNPEHINIGDFLLIKFEKKKTVIHYIAKVVFKYSVTEYEVLYLRKKAGSSKFIFPIVEDKASVDVRDVVLQLPKPTFSKGTSRTSSLYSFSVGLTRYNVQ